MTALQATRGQELSSSHPQRSRFAPSPTGLLHLGHAFSAVAAHDFARARVGEFLLRIEDIDPGRTREAFVDAICQDLTWLGLHWDGPPLRQSQRMPFYAAALDRLRNESLIYPCFCTRADIAASVSAPHGPEGPLYPGTCRRLDAGARASLLATTPHAWRLDMTEAARRVGPLMWTDHGRTVQAQPDRLGDVVLARKEVATSYHLAVTIDDAASGISDVVRGVDLFEATHVHRLLQALLALPTPAYHHHQLLEGPDGRRLAKRDGARSLADLRLDGADPAVLIASIRARLALSEPH